jgi:hypothetical protein
MAAPRSDFGQGLGDHANPLLLEVKPPQLPASQPATGSSWLSPASVPIGTKRLADSHQRRTQLRSIPADVARGTVRRTVEADIIRVGVTPAPIAGEDRWPALLDGAVMAVPIGVARAQIYHGAPSSKFDDVRVGGGRAHIE